MFFGNTHANANSTYETLNGDWFGAWNKEINKEFLDKCNNVLDAECAFGMLGDYRKTDNPRALRLHKDWMTGRPTIRGWVNAS